MDIGAILISNKILIEKEVPAWMYRESPLFKEDSGWRVFSGTETEDYLDVASNFKFLSAETLILIDDDIKVNLLAPVNSSFERDPKTKLWKPIEKGGVFSDS